MHLYRIGLDGTGLRRLDKDNFNHTGDLADNCRYFVDNYSRVDTAPVSALYDANGKLLMTLEETDLHLLFEAGYKFPEIFTAKAADGITDLYGVIYALAEAYNAARGAAPRYQPRINRTEVGKAAGEQITSLHTRRNAH